MDVTNKRTAMIVISTILWLAVSVLGWYNQFLPAIWLGIILIAIYFILANAKQGVIPKKFLVYPILSWAALWMITFYFCKYYADLFAGAAPTFRILGMHPSLAFAVIGYWAGGVLTLLAGFYLLRDEWLSDQDWDNFTAKLKKIDEETGGVK